MALSSRLAAESRELVDCRIWWSPFLYQEAHRAVLSVEWLESHGDDHGATAWLTALRVTVARDASIGGRSSGRPISGLEAR